MRRKALLAILITSVMMILGAITVYGDSNPTTEWKDYAAASFAGGDGSETNPYQIGTPEQLAKLSQDVAEGNSYSGSHFRLEKDIDLSGHLWNPIGQYRYKDHKELSRPFKGSFDGNGKTITGMIVDQRKDQYCGGFFGACRMATDDANEIQDLTIVDAQIYNSGENIAGRSRNGILVGLVDNNKKFQLNNITVSGTIHVEGKSEAGNTVGGMIGEASRVTAKNCKVTNVAISGPEDIYNTGGFVGLDLDSYYENCTVTGTITGCAVLGGFVGYAAGGNSTEKGVFKNCLADVKVDGTGWRIGGFVGFCMDIGIRNCVAKGDVSTTRIRTPYIGTFGGAISDTTVTDSHGAGIATCKSTTTFAAGGFVGEFRSGNTVSGCSFDNVRNKDIKAIGGETPQDKEGITGTSTQGVKANICKDYEARHNPVKVAKKAATCTEDGSEEYYICEACGTLYSDAEQKNIVDAPSVIQATGHKFGEWKVVKEPTTTAEGTEERTCENCSEKEIRSIAKLEPSEPEKKIVSVAFSKKAYVYNGKTKKPAVKVKDTQGKVVPAKEYTVKYPKGRKKVGTYTVSVKLKTGAKNTVKASFRIIPKTTQIRSLKKGGKSFTVKWFRKGPQVTGYQVQYSTSKNFNNPKSKRIKGYNHNTKKVKKLAKKKTYYVRVRTYKKIGKTTYYANWSKVKKVTTR